MQSSIAPGLPPLRPQARRARRVVVGPFFGLLVGLSGCIAVLGAHAQSLAQAPVAGPISDQTAPLQSDPTRAATIVAEANRLAGEGKRDAAVELLDGALRANPKDARLRFAYGVLQAERGEAGVAIDVFTQLAADFPELPEPHNNLAVLHAARGELDQARAALENAIRAVPGYALAYENLGDLHLRLAVRAYERALAASPRAASARTKLDLTRDLTSRVVKPSAGAFAPRGDQ